MDKKTTGIIAVVVAVLLCGLPGLCSLCFGAVFALVGMVPGAEIDMFGSNDPSAAITTGGVMFCLGLVGLIVAALVAYFTLRKKPGDGPVSNEPLPPAI